ncbi:MAG: right-handed parallel beta-helix repeat-containing protein [Crocinitomicaceae bacterium]
MNKVVLISTLLLLFSCKKNHYISETDQLVNQNFTQNVRVQGHEFDGLLIENCVFDGGELYISDVDSVTVRNCTFKNQKKNGMRIGFGGEASHIIIENCSFKNIGSNGIDSHEDAPNCSIKGCYFENCALSDIGAAMGQPHHCIYWKGKNVKIIENEFITGEQLNGNAISHRSSGLIARNKIKGAKKYGIMYFADHPGGDSLIIENNILYECANGIALSTPGILDYHNKWVDVRFNTIYDAETYSVFISDDYESTTNISVYGNILVQSNERYIQHYFEIDTSYNLTSTTDIGFINAKQGDLHILSNSEAAGFCDGLTKFPLIDIDGDLRTSTNLDAGADEVD